MQIVTAETLANPAAGSPAGDATDPGSSMPGVFALLLGTMAQPTDVLPSTNLSTIATSVPSAPDAGSARTPAAGSQEVLDGPMAVIPEAVSEPMSLPQLVQHLLGLLERIGDEVGSLPQGDALIPLIDRMTSLLKQIEEPHVSLPKAASGKGEEETSANQAPADQVGGETVQEIAGQALGLLGMIAQLLGLRQESVDVASGGQNVPGDDAFPMAQATPLEELTARLSRMDQRLTQALDGRSITGDMPPAEGEVRVPRAQTQGRADAAATHVQAVTPASGTLIQRPGGLPLSQQASGSVPVGDTPAQAVPLQPAEVPNPAVGGSKAMAAAHSLSNPGMTTPPPQAVTKEEPAEPLMAAASPSGAGEVSSVPPPVEPKDKASDGHSLRAFESQESLRVEAEDSQPGSGDQERAFQGQGFKDEWQGAEVSRPADRDVAAPFVFQIPGSMETVGPPRESGQTESVQQPAAPRTWDGDPPAPTAPSMHLEIDQPDLGRVRVHVALSGDRVYTNVVTDRTGVHDYLVLEQPKLHSGLQAQGLEVGEIRVSLDHQGPQGDGTTRQDLPQRDGHRGPNLLGSETNEGGPAPTIHEIGVKRADLALSVFA